MPKFIEKHTVSMDHRAFLRATTELKNLVEGDCSEGALQAHLETFPYILSQQFAHCHHVFPKVQLGSRFVADFFCLETPSYGNEWIAIEIEPPDTRVATKAGRKTAKLEHALQQIRDWRKWVEDNIDCARRSRDQSGLGLEDIRPRFLGEVIIGRRRDHTEAFNALRSQLHRDELITVKSWDGVIERAEQRARIYLDFAEIFRTGSL